MVEEDIEKYRLSKQVADLERKAEEHRLVTSGLNREIRVLTERVRLSESALGLQNTNWQSYDTLFEKIEGYSKGKITKKALTISKEDRKGRETRATSRWIAVGAYLARTRLVPRQTLAQIGKEFGGRDHSTIGYLLGQVENDVTLMAMAWEIYKYTDLKQEEVEGSEK